MSWPLNNNLLITFYISHVIALSMSLCAIRPSVNKSKKLGPLRNKGNINVPFATLLQLPNSRNVLVKITFNPPLLNLKVPISYTITIFRVYFHAVSVVCIHSNSIHSLLYLACKAADLTCKTMYAPFNWCLNYFSAPEYEKHPVIGEGKYLFLFFIIP